MGEFFVYALFFGALLFLFPVFVHADVYVDIRENNANFSVRLFRLIKIVGGYVTVTTDGIILHFSEKKGKLIPYGKIKRKNKKFQLSDGFQLYKFHQVVETGGSETMWGIMLAAALQSAGGAAYGVLKTKHPFLSLKNGTLLAEQPCLKYSAQIVVILNGLVVVIAAIKRLLEVIINWSKKRKLTAFSKKRQSN